MTSDIRFAKIRRAVGAIRSLFGRSGKQSSGENHLGSSAAFALLLILMLAIGGWIIVRSDREARADLLQQARLVAQALNLAQVQALSGTEEDYHSPYYQRLKAQLMSIVQANPDCRWFYLMGRKADGTIFFFVDSVSPEDVEDYSPPGQVFDEVSEENRRVFDNKAATVEGPVPDRWGIWVSALVPMIDPQTRDLVAVLGMDIDARNWKWKVAARAALPLGLIFVLFLALARVLIAIRQGKGWRTEAFAKVPLRRHLPSLAVALLVVLAVLIGGRQFYLNQEKSVREATEKQLISVARLKVDAVAAWLEDQLGDVAMLAGNPIFTRDIAEFLANPKAEVADQLREVFRLYQTDNPCANILLVDSNGRVRWSLTDSPEVYLADPTVLATALRDRKPVFIDLRLDQFGERPILGVVAPLISGSGQAPTPVGSIILVYDATRVLYPLLQQWPAPRDSAEALLVRRDGDAVLYLSNLRLQRGTALKLRIPLTQTDVPAVQAVLGRQGIVQGKDYRGVETLAALQPIPDSPWFLVAKVDAAEMLADWQTRAVLILMLVISIVGMVGALVGVFWLRRERASNRTLVQSAEALRESEERHRSILAASPDGIVIITAEGRTLMVSPSAATMFGFDRNEDLRGRPIDDFIVPEDQERAFSNMALTFQGQLSGPVEYRARRVDGSTFDMEANAETIRDAKGIPIQMVVAIRDITARKQREHYLETAREVLRILNEPGAPQETIQHIVAALKTATGFDAVGIRLQNGDDFPYFAQQGFSGDFLQTENTLVARAPNGGICRDKDGNIRRECTCGLVLSGKTDPAHPFCTKGGSFWTSDSSSILDLPSDVDPRLNPRNRCIHQGYASMALVPIQAQGRIVGLIHLNDRRKGCFTPDTIAILESIASQIGTALLRKQAEAALRESEAQLSNALEITHAGHWEYDVASDTFTFNDNFYRIFRTTAEQVGGYQLSSAEYARRFCHPDDLAVVGRETQAEIETTDPDYSRQLEHRILYADGTVGHIVVRFFVVKDSQGRTIKTRGVNQDITAHKQAEEALRESKEKIHQLVQHVESVREEEQKRVSRELHDDLGQILTALNMDLAMVVDEYTGPDGVKTRLGDMQKLVDGGIHSIHSICRRLRPGALEDLGLEEVLSSLVDDWKQRNQVECTLSADIEDAALSDDIKTAIYRMVQEALTNVSRHAGASKVDIKLVEDGQTLRCSVADDGRGIDADAKGDPITFGLLGMRERVEALGGELHIKSMPGKGTRIEGSIPLEGERG